LVLFLWLPCILKYHGSTVPSFQLSLGPRGRGAVGGLRQETELRRAGRDVQLQPRPLQQDQQGWEINDFQFCMFTALKNSEEFSGPKA
jgi:hypothetical protein